MFPARADLDEALVGIGGFRLRISCRGSGSPTVVLEAGLDTPGNWEGFDVQVAEVTRVCAYDRAGIGRSDPRPADLVRTPGLMADELDRLLVAAHEPGPYVLVGHSFGGLVSVMYAYRYADVTAGLVLVDSQYRTQLGEEEAGGAISKSTTTQELHPVNLDGLALVVLSAGENMGSARIFQSWRMWQDALAGLSSQSVHVVVTGAGHAIEDDNPEIVLEAIREVVEAAKTGTALPPCGDVLVRLGGVCS